METTAATQTLTGLPYSTTDVGEHWDSTSTLTELVHIFDQPESTEKPTVTIPATQFAKMVQGSKLRILDAVGNLVFCTPDRIEANWFAETVEEIRVVYLQWGEYCWQWSMLQLQQKWIWRF